MRTVHKRFQEANTTFRQWVLDKRLGPCRRTLANARCNDMTVAQIAYCLSFNPGRHSAILFRPHFPRYARSLLWLAPLMVILIGVANVVE